MYLLLRGTFYKTIRYMCFHPNLELVLKIYIKKNLTVFYSTDHTCIIKNTNKQKNKFTLNFKRIADQTTKH